MPDSIYQLITIDETTYYVQAKTREQAVLFVEESYQTTVNDCSQLNFTPVNTTIHTAYEQKVTTHAIA